ncbi:hypothetical protein AVEN_60309-1 [Araneus ventricosus]|uniref:Uncharacterized protein n=1 Tax=Araneus ventricosus TaxID=182803 RepID=A0A4Y2GU35_ARAVE|nr:hypothetical protein AVEN_60309-1 [Araneus ventricosus]
MHIAFTCFSSLYFENKKRAEPILQKLLAVRPFGEAWALAPEGSRLKTRCHLRSAVYVGVLQTKSYTGVDRPPAGVVRKFGEEGVSSGVVILI